MRYFGRFAGLTNDAGGEWLELSGFTFGFDPVIHTLPDGQTVVSRFLPRPVLLELGSDRITAELTKAVLQGTFFTNVEIEGYAEDATGLRLVDESASAVSSLPTSRPAAALARMSS